MERLRVGWETAFRLGVAHQKRAEELEEQLAQARAALAEARAGGSRTGVDREALAINVLPSEEGLTRALRWLANQEGVREDWYAEEVPAIMAALATQPTPAPVDADAVERAVGGVLFNAMNFPPRVQALMLAQDVGPLRRKVVDAVLAALATTGPLSQVIPQAQEAGGGE